MHWARASARALLSAPRPWAGLRKTWIMKQQYHYSWWCYTFQILCGAAEIRTPITCVQGRCPADWTMAPKPRGHHQVECSGEEGLWDCVGSAGFEPAFSASEADVLAIWTTTLKHDRTSSTLDCRATEESSTPLQAVSLAIARGEAGWPPRYARCLRPSVPKEDSNLIHGMPCHCSTRLSYLDVGSSMSNDVHRAHRLD